MTRLNIAVVFAVVLVAGAAACRQAPSDSEQRIAELQKELEATKQEIAAVKEGAAQGTSESALPGEPLQPAPAQPSPSARPQGAARPPAAAPARPSGRPASQADNAAADEAKKAAEQLARDKEAAQRAVDEQRALNARQAEANQELQRQLDDMKPREITLPSGTIVPVRTTAEISTKTASSGSVFEGLLERDLVADGIVLAKAGSRVTCVVVSSDPGGRVKGVASMAVAARSIAGTNGNTISIKTGSYGVEAASSKGDDAKRTGILAGAGAVIGGIAGGGKGAAIGAGAGAATGVAATMATRGDAAAIPAETLIQFRLSAPATVVYRK